MLQQLQKFKSLRPCIQILWWKFCWIVLIILCVRTFLSYFLDSWLPRFLLLKFASVTWNIIQFWHNSMKISKFLIFIEFCCNNFKNPYLFTRLCDFDDENIFRKPKCYCIGWYLFQDAFDHQNRRKLHLKSEDLVLSSHGTF